MSRYKPLVERRETDRKDLISIIQNPFSDPNLTIRAKAILRFLDGIKGDAIAKELNVRPNTVSDWRKKYESDGIEGLYAKAPKGKRGSSTRDKVLETFANEHPEGGWNTKALAEVVGTSQDTVRRALKDEHLTVSKSYIWDKEIKSDLAEVCLNAIGLYMAKEEAGLIIRVEPQMCIQSSSYITTCNRGLAKSLEQLSQGDKGLSLEDAIITSVQQMKEVHRGNKEIFQDFLGKLLKEHSGLSGSASSNENTIYYILYWYERSKEIRPILQKAGMIVETTEDIDVWIKMIKPWIDLMSRDIQKNDTSKEAHSLISLIDLYMNKTNAFVEPFEWRRSSLCDN